MEVGPRKTIKMRMLFQRPETKEPVWIKCAFEDGQTNPMLALLLVSDGAMAVCLYTGKNDKDGKEIYDGDIMRGDNGASYVVEYNRDFAMFTLSRKCNDDTIVSTMPLSEKLREDPSLRVVGNTHGVLNEN